MSAAAFSSWKTYRRGQDKMPRLHACLLEPCEWAPGFIFCVSLYSFAKKENLLYYKKQKHNAKKSGGWSLADREGCQNKVLNRRLVLPNSSSGCQCVRGACCMWREPPKAVKSQEPLHSPAPRNAGATRCSVEA